MENELTALRLLLSQGFVVLAFLLAMLAPAGLAVTAAGSSRLKHRFASFGWMILLLPLVSIATYLFGWMFYHAFPAGPGITGGFRDAWSAAPWAETMGPGLDRDENGGYTDLLLRSVVFIAFAWFAAALLAAASLERIRGGGLMILAVILSGLFFAIAAAWGWSEKGWMVEIMGFHDPFGLGVLSTLTGGFTLGVLVVLKARILRRDAQGHLQAVPGHSDGLVMTGRLLMVIGLLGMALAATHPAASLFLGDGTFIVASNVYGAPISLGGLLLNILMAASGGLLIGHVLTDGNLRMTLTLPVAAIVGIIPGSDFYHPLESFILALFLTWLCHRSYHWLENRFYLDDVTGTVAFHGFGGFWGLVVAGILLWGYPASTDPGYVHINPFGQAAGAMLLFWLLGFLPGYVAARVLNFFGVLRLAQVVELCGQDIASLRNTEEASYQLYRQERRYVEDLIEERH